MIQVYYAIDFNVDLTQDTGLAPTLFELGNGGLIALPRM